MNRPDNNSLGLLAVFSFGMFVLALVYHMLIGGRGFIAAIFLALIFTAIVAVLIYLFLMTTLGMEWSQAARRKIGDKAVEVKGKIDEARAPSDSGAGAASASAGSSPASGLTSEPEPELKPEPAPAHEPEPASEPEPSESAPPAAASSEDYDRDGVVEGTGEGTRPAGLDAPRGGGADDLKMIKGVGPKLEILCNSLGFWHFDQVAAWSDDEVAWVNANLPGFPGRVSRDNWVDQAKTLAAGGDTEFSKRVEGGDVY